MVHTYGTCGVKGLMSVLRLYRSNQVAGWTGIGIAKADYARGQLRITRATVDSFFVKYMGTWPSCLVELLSLGLVGLIGARIS